MWLQVISLFITTAGSVLSGYFASKARVHASSADSSAKAAEFASLRPPR